MNEHPQGRPIWYEEEHGTFPENNQAVIHFGQGNQTLGKGTGRWEQTAPAQTRSPTRCRAEVWWMVSCTAALPQREVRAGCPLVWLDPRLLQGIAQPSLSPTSDGRGTTILIHGHSAKRSCFPLFVSSFCKISMKVISRKFCTADTGTHWQIEVTYLCKVGLAKYFPNQ